VRRFVLAFACAACGGGSSRLALALDGTVYGQSVAAVDAVSKVQTPFQSGSFADIFISNEPDVCGVISAARLATNRQAIRIALATRTDAGVSAPTAPGTYPVYSRSVEGPTRGNRATISYELHDASCKKVRTADGISGSVAVLEVGSSGYAGTLDITFSDNAGHVSGTFSTTPCAALRGNLDGICF